MVDKVFPGQPIKASTINAVIDATGGGPKTGAGESVYQPKEILVKNTTQTIWGAGEPFRVISALHYTSDQSDALNKFLTFGAIVRGNTIASDTPVFRIGLTKESIKPDEIGRCIIPGLMGAKVYVTDWSHKYVKYNSSTQRLESTGTESEAQFGLIGGNSGISSNNGFCFIAPLAGVGGGLKAYIDSTHDNVDVKKIVPGSYTSFSDTYGNGELTINGRYGVSIDSDGQTRNVTKLIAGDNVSFSYGSTYYTLTIAGVPSYGFRSTQFSSDNVYEYLEQGNYVLFSQTLNPGKLTVTLDLQNNTFVSDIGCNANGDVVVTKKDVFNSPS